MIKIYPKDSQKKLSEHFKLSEFHCHGNGCCKYTYVDEGILPYLEKIRAFFGKPLYINSGYRCYEHNKKVGGNRNSGHLKGKAVDIAFGKDITREQLAKYAESIGVPRIGTYKNSPNMIHIGTGDKCYWLDSDYSIKTFGGCKYKKPTGRFKKGSKGEGVKYVQWWLKFRGIYEGEIDGSYGPKTVEAVNKYRMKKGWKPSGVLYQKGIDNLDK